jgi:hypothetical protein
MDSGRRITFTVVCSQGRRGYTHLDSRTSFLRMIPGQVGTVYDLILVLLGTGTTTRAFAIQIVPVCYVRACKQEVLAGSTESIRLVWQYVRIWAEHKFERAPLAVSSPSLFTGSTRRQHHSAIHKLDRFRVGFRVVYDYVLSRFLSGLEPIKSYTFAIQIKDPISCSIPKAIYQFI